LKLKEYLGGRLPTSRKCQEKNELLFIFCPKMPMKIEFTAGEWMMFFEKEMR